jgi:hypothetical protein
MASVKVSRNQIHKFNNCNELLIISGRKLLAAIRVDPAGGRVLPSLRASRRLIISLHQNLLLLFSAIGRWLDQYLDFSLDTLYFQLLLQQVASPFLIIQFFRTVSPLTRANHGNQCRQINKGTKPACLLLGVMSIARLHTKTLGA